MNETNDNELVEKYLCGDEKSFETLVKRYLKPIYSFVYRSLNNRQDAEEITQETFLKLWRNIKRFDKNKSFKVWIFAIAKNALLDFLKKSAKFSLAPLK